MKYLLLVALLATIYSSADAVVWEVGPDKQHKTVSSVMNSVASGDTVDIDAGEYTADVGTWSADNLTVRGKGGRAVLKAGGISAGSKAIWVIRGKNTTVENIEFRDCKVPDRNGAGIRQEGAGLILRNCGFFDNEDGILAGDNAESDILIEYCEFARNSYSSGDGQSHNIYINHIRSFTFRYNSTHHARVGHCLKSRAYKNLIYSNRIADEEDGNSSYLIDLPNGGLSVICGNIMSKSSISENRTLISYGAEGLTNPLNKLYCVNNTMTSRRSVCTFLRVPNKADTVVYANNLLIGTGDTSVGVIGSVSNFRFDNSSLAGISMTDATDYTIDSSSPIIDAGFELADPEGDGIIPPSSEYVSPTGMKLRQSHNRIDAGAREYSPATGIADDRDSEHLPYPVPAGNFVCIAFAKGALVGSEDGMTIYDIYGIQVPASATRTGESLNSIVYKANVSYLAPGIYFAVCGTQKVAFVKS